MTFNRIRELYLPREDDNEEPYIELESGSVAVRVRIDEDLCNHPHFWYACKLLQEIGERQFDRDQKEQQLGLQFFSSE